MTSNAPPTSRLRKVSLTVALGLLVLEALAAALTSVVFAVTATLFRGLTANANPSGAVSFVDELRGIAATLAILGFVALATAGFGIVATIKSMSGIAWARTALAATLVLEAAASIAFALWTRDSAAGVGWSLAVLHAVLAASIIRHPR